MRTLLATIACVTLVATPALAKDAFIPLFRATEPPPVPESERLEALWDEYNAGCQYNPFGGYIEGCYAIKYVPPQYYNLIRVEFITGGYSGEVTVEMVVANMRANLETAKAIIRYALPVMEAMGDGTPCACSTALAGAIITEPTRIPAKNRADRITLTGLSLASQATMMAVNP